MKIHRDISKYNIQKARSILVKTLDAASVSEFPLDWTQFSNLPKAADVTTKTSSTFGGLGVNYDNMTHIVPTGATTVNSTVLKKLNTLNYIWKQLNIIRIGFNSDVDITRSFIMLEDTSGTDVKILATMPGQYFSTDITSTQFSSFSWYTSAIADTTQLIKIDRQSDPFNGGLDLAVGFVMGFTSGTLRGVVGVHYNTYAIQQLVYPLFDRSSAEVSVYIWNTNQSMIISKDSYNIIETTPNIVSEILNG